MRCMETGVLGVEQEAKRALAFETYLTNRSAELAESDKASSQNKNTLCPNRCFTEVSSSA